MMVGIGPRRYVRRVGEIRPVPYEQVLRHAPRMRPIHRTILYATTIYQSYRDIAADLQIPVGTVRSRLSRARAALARLQRTERHAALIGGTDAI